MSSPAQQPIPPTTWLMPREAYTSAEWFEREQRDLFSRCWAFAGMTDDIPAEGDYTTVSVGGHPIVVVRGPNDEMRAFHNLCRHRGVQLLEGRGNVRRGISCFYHRWRYGLDGSLKSVTQPEQFPDLRKEDLGLIPAAVDSWNGLLFVHVDEHPTDSLTDWLGEFRDRLGPFRPLELQEIKVERHEIAANWKLFLENHIDGYHLWHLHATSIRGLDHSRQQWRPAGRHWTFYEPESKPGTHADAAMTGLPVISTHEPGQGFGSSVHLVFPNLGIAGGSTFFAILRVVPVAADRSIVEMRTRIAPLDTSQQTQAALQVVRTSATALLRDVISRPLRSFGMSTGRRRGGSGADFVAEDIMAAEAAQRAMYSSRFAVGPMARDYESSITAFQRNILDYLETA